MAEGPRALRGQTSPRRSRCRSRAIRLPLSRSAFSSECVHEGIAAEGQLLQGLGADPDRRPRQMAATLVLITRQGIERENPPYYHTLAGCARLGNGALRGDQGDHDSGERPFRHTICSVQNGADKDTRGRPATPGVPPL